MNTNFIPTPKDEALNIISDMQLITSISKISKHPIPSNSDFCLKDAYTALLYDDIRTMGEKIVSAANYWFNGDEETQRRLGDLADKLGDLKNGRLKDYLDSKKESLS